MTIELSRLLVIQRVDELLRLLPNELNRPWSASDLSARVGISESHLRRTCLALTGDTPMRYLKRLRLNAATQLLRTSSLSVKEITSIVGCQDLSHFIRDFRQQYGRTPAAYRTENAGGVAAHRDFSASAVRVLANE